MIKTIFWMAKKENESSFNKLNGHILFSQKLKIEKIFYIEKILKFIFELKFDN